MVLENQLPLEIVSLSLTCTYQNVEMMVLWGRLTLHTHLINTFYEMELLPQKPDVYQHGIQSGQNL